MLSRLVLIKLFISTNSPTVSGGKIGTEGEEREQTDFNLFFSTWTWLNTLTWQAGSDVTARWQENSSGWLSFNAVAVMPNLALTLNI